MVKTQSSYIPSERPSFNEWYAHISKELRSSLAGDKQKKDENLQ